MLRGLYSAATAIDAATLNQDVVARNLAHINVPGYRRTGLAFETFENSDLERFGNESNLGTGTAELHTDFTPGAFQKTGRPLDLAIRGDGFFEIDGTDGPLYTRNGAFHITNDGQLVTGDGLPVSGRNGPIVVPPETTPSQITIARDGSVLVSSTQVGQLNLVRFTDNQQLIQAGTTMFRAPPEMPAQEAGEKVAIEQGSREMANVSAVEELVRLLAGLRYSEASQRALRTIGDIIAKRTEQR